MTTLRSSILIALLTLCSGSACHDRSPPRRVDDVHPGRPSFPSAEEVASVQILPGEAIPGSWPEHSLDRSEQLTEVVRWLERVDWDREPSDIRLMELHPVSPLVLRKHDDSEVRFGLVDGALIVWERFGQWPANTEELKGIFGVDGGD